MWLSFTSPQNLTHLNISGSVRKIYHTKSRGLCKIFHTEIYHREFDLARTNPPPPLVAAIACAGYAMLDSHGAGALLSQAAHCKRVYRSPLSRFCVPPGEAVQVALKRSMCAKESSFKEPAIVYQC